MIGSRGLLAVVGLTSLVCTAAAEERTLAAGPIAPTTSSSTSRIASSISTKPGECCASSTSRSGKCRTGRSSAKATFERRKASTSSMRATPTAITSCRFSLLSERSGPSSRARAGRRPGRPDHDPRLAQRAEVRPAPLSGDRLDGRLHRRQQLGHGRYLAHDARIDSDRDSAVGRAEATATQWTR